MLPELRDASDDATQFAGITKDAVRPSYTRAAFRIAYLVQSRQMLCQ